MSKNRPPASLQIHGGRCRAEGEEFLVTKTAAKLAPLQQQSAPLRNKIIASLRTAIATGVLEPGARLVERDLCAQLNVSRTSLREALRELQADGVLLQTGARGLSVSVVSRDEAENAYHLRAALEAVVVEQFIARASEREVNELTRDGESLKDAYRGSDVGRMLQAKHRFLDRICSGARNSLAFNMINRLVLRTASLRTQSLKGAARREQSIRETEEIIAAIRDRDIARARAAAVENVNNSMRSAFRALDEQKQAAPPPPAEAPRRRSRVLVAQ